MEFMKRWMKKITEFNNKFDLIVVGAGAAGLMAAGTAAESGKSVLIFDKNEKLGRKVRITGKGRCNVTNNCDVNTVIAAAVGNGRFLYSALNYFSPEDAMLFFESHGVPLKTERGNRVFPQSDNANDIADALEKYALSGNTKVIKKSVTDILTADGSVKGVISDGKEYFSQNVLLATGGASYRATGSTGDGYRFAKKLGHTIVEPRPSLVAVTSDDSDCPEMQGLSMKNCGVKVVDNEKNKIIYSDFGELLFTHFGISGPVILSSSAHMRNMKSGKYSVVLDIKPALSEEQLDKRIQRDLEKNNNRNFANSLSELLPQKMIDVIVERSTIPGDTKCNSVTKEQRKKLLSVLKNFKINVMGFRSLNEAIVTSGGVSVKEINPKTMESKLVHGLYFAGELIDVDAYTGGFNLQIAFATGRLAGDSLN
jgi:predicted Rossmann fold flavoprotein